MNNQPVSINQQQYNLFMGRLPGNYPAESVNPIESDLRKMIISRDQYKQDAADAEFKLSLMLVELNNMQQQFKDFSKESECITVQLLCSLVTTKIDAIKKHQHFNINTILNG